MVGEVGCGDTTRCPQRSLETGACVQRILSAGRTGVPLVRTVVSLYLQHLNLVLLYAML